MDTTEFVDEWSVHSGAGIGGVGAGSVGLENDASRHNTSTRGVPPGMGKEQLHLHHRRRQPDDPSDAHLGFARKVREVEEFAASKMGARGGLPALSYVDLDGDEVALASEAEFREARRHTQRRSSSLSPRARPARAASSSGGGAAVSQEASAALMHAKRMSSPRLPSALTSADTTPSEFARKLEQEAKLAELLDVSRRARSPPPVPGSQVCIRALFAH